MQTPPSTPSYSIIPLGDQVLFRIVDLAKPALLVLLEDSAAQQAAEVLLVGPRVQDPIVPGDLLIITQGLEFYGYKQGSGTVHLVPEGCFIGKYVKDVEEKIVTD